MKLPVALIDDHPLTANGIGAWLESTGRFEICGSARSAEEARSLFESLENLPRIVILDMVLGEDDGLALIPLIRESAEKRGAPPPGIVVCSMYEDPFLIQNAMKAGADGFVAKSADSGEIVAAIDAVLRGEIHLNPKYDIPVKEWASKGLSAREREIVVLIKQQFSNRQIAEKMGLSVRTVENYLSNIYIKTNTYSRSELAGL